MSEDVKRKKVQIEVDMVEMKIEVSEQFFDNMDKAKKMVADQRGYDVSYGEYIEEAMNDLVKMVDDYAYKIKEAAEIIKKQDDMLGNPGQQAVEIEQQPVDPETDEEETEPPAELYAHIEEDSAKEIMYV